MLFNKTNAPEQVLNENLLSSSEKIRAPPVFWWNRPPPQARRERFLLESGKYDVLGKISVNRLVLWNYSVQKVTRDMFFKQYCKTPVKKYKSEMWAAKKKYKLDATNR